MALRGNTIESFDNHGSRYDSLPEHLESHCTLDRGGTMIDILLNAKSLNMHDITSGY